MENSTKTQVFISPPVASIKIGFFRTLRIVSKPQKKILEKKWFKIDKEGSVFELEGHDKDSLWLGPVTDSDYGKYYCEVRLEGEDGVFKSDTAQVKHPASQSEPKVEVRRRVSSCSTEIPTHYIQHTDSTQSSTCTSTNVSPAHPYFRGFVSSRNPSVSSPPPRTPAATRPVSICCFDFQEEKKLSDGLSRNVSESRILARIPTVSPELVETGNSSSSSFATHEDSFPDLPKIRPFRMFRHDSTFSSESDIFHDVSNLTSTPIAHSDTPEWSLASSGYPMASPSLNYSFSSSLPASPASQLRNTFFEMATLPRRSSLSPLSAHSDAIPRPNFKNEQDFRLAGYQQVLSPTPSGKPRPNSVTSHFRFSLSSASRYGEKN